MTCLVTQLDCKLQVLKNSLKLTIFGNFNELLTTQYVNIAKSKFIFFLNFLTNKRPLSHCVHSMFKNVHFYLTFEAAWIFYLFSMFFFVVITRVKIIVKHECKNSILRNICHLQLNKRMLLLLCISLHSTNSTVVSLINKLLVITKKFYQITWSNIGKLYEISPDTCFLKVRHCNLILNF